MGEAGEAVGVAEMGLAVAVQIGVGTDSAIEMGAVTGVAVAVAGKVFFFFF